MRFFLDSLPRIDSITTEVLKKKERTCGMPDPDTCVVESVPDCSEYIYEPSKKFLASNTSIFISPFVQMSPMLVMC